MPSPHGSVDHKEREHVPQRVAFGFRKPVEVLRIHPVRSRLMGREEWYPDPLP